MRHLFVLFLICVSGLAGQSIDIVPGLEKGDHFVIEQISTRKNSQQPDNDAQFRTLIQVDVMEANADGYRLLWRPGEPEIDNPRVTENPIVRAAMNAASDLDFEVLLNPVGEYAGLGNEAEVREEVNRLMEIMIAEVEREIPEAQRSQLRGIMAQVMSPQVMIGSATKDIQTYFALYGIAMDEGEQIEAPSEFPNPFGGEPLQATIRLTLEALNENSATISNVTVFSSDSIKAMTLALIQQTGVAIPPAGERELEQVRFDMQDESRFVFERQFGLMTEVHTLRRISAAGQQRLDQVGYRVVEFPTAK